MWWDIENVFFVVKDFVEKSARVIFNKIEEFIRLILVIYDPLVIQPVEKLGGGSAQQGVHIEWFQEYNWFVPSTTCIQLLLVMIE